MYTDFIIHVGMPEIFLLDARVPHPHSSEFLEKKTSHIRSQTHIGQEHIGSTLRFKNGKNKEGSIFMRHWSCWPTGADSWGLYRL